MNWGGWRRGRPIARAEAPPLSKRGPGRALVLLAVASAFVMAMPPSVRAQRWRTVTAARQKRTVDTLHVRATFGAGTLSLVAAPQSLLYDVRMRYDADALRARERFDSVTNTLRIGPISGERSRFAFDPRRFGDEDSDDQPGELALALARGVPLDLDLVLGAAHGTLDFSGLWVSRLSLATGASETTVLFGTPNPQPMRELELQVGAAGLTVQELGNARAEHITVQTGAAGAELDLSGAWQGVTQLDVRVLLGGITLRVPRDVGIVSRVRTRFGGMDAGELTQRDGAYYSANYASAKRHLSLDGSATLGGVEIDWID